uniref:Uncharacterized protein n=1 Tax=Arundo donax TaxID=35708 RepID=A0A0A9AEY0_ARUDO
MRQMVKIILMQMQRICRYSILFGKVECMSYSEFEKLLPSTYKLCLYFVCESAHLSSLNVQAET